MPHVNPQVMATFHVALPPYVSEQLSLRDHAARVSDERCQQSVLNRRQMNGVASAQFRACTGVDQNIRERILLVEQQRIAIMRSINASRGFTVIRTTIQSDNTRVPPVTEKKPPPICE